MSRSEHRHYLELAPFLREFQSGGAILVYHKLGFPKLMERNKGLHISPRLFDSQLAELKAAGFTSRNLDSSLEQADKVAITFDDGYTSTFLHALEPLAKHGFKAIQFLSSAHIGKRSTWDKCSEPLMDKAQVREWLQAGHSIGSHSVTHASLDKISESEAKEEITASRQFLEDEFGVEIQHFCYPYGHWNQRISAMVAEAGYLTGSTSDLGINTNSTNPYELKRIHAYAPLRDLKGLYYFLRR